MIHLSNISKIYTIDHQDFYAIDHLSLSLSTKQNTVIIGKSGSGKSTLLTLINGLTPVSKGEISFSEKVKSATVFQEPRLLPWLTLKQNAIFWNPNANPDDLFKEFELTGFENIYPHEASGGMAYKVALIRAFLFDANFLLMDEPFSSLDYFTRISMQEKLLQISKTNNIGLFFITHNIEEAVFLGDRILVLHHGKLIKEFTNTTHWDERSHKNTPLRDEILDTFKNIN